MSILAKLKAAEPQTAKQNILVTGRSGSGKSRLAGTLDEGRTLFLEVAGKENGSHNAKAEAKRRGNQLDAISLTTLSDFLKVAQELREDSTYENVYVDSLSGLTFMAADDPEISQLIQAKKSGNPFAGYQRIQVEIDKVHRAFSELLYTKTPKNIIFTLAIEPKLDASGLPSEVTPIMAGKASYQVFTRPAPTILTLATKNGEQGEERVMLTSNAGPYIARLNGVLDELNPKLMKPDLGELFRFLKEQV